MEGVRFTEGSLLHAERIAEENAPLVAQLESKRAIIVGKTNVPEFCAGWGFLMFFAKILLCKGESGTWNAVECWPSGMKHRIVMGIWEAQPDYIRLLGRPRRF